jgi:predicted phage terminase large subunit-like protein
MASIIPFPVRPVISRVVEAARTPEGAARLQRYTFARGRESYWTFRKILNPHMIKCWWQRDLAYHIQNFFTDLVAGKRPKLVIQACPQHGKSEQIRDAICWCAGKYPHLKTIFTSYSDELCTTTNLAVQRKMSSPQFRSIFYKFRLPNWEKADLADRWRHTTSVIEFPGSGGSFRTTTVKGQINGQGLDLGIIDDPIKGRKEALSEVTRKMTWEWLVDDFFARFSKDAGMMMINTRWHVDDPAGRFLERFPETKVLTYQAIATADDWSVARGYRKVGEALFEEFKPLDFLLERRKAMSQASWESEYQQNPFVVGGGVIPIDKMRIVPFIDKKNIIRTVRYIDKAGTQDGGAYTACVLMHTMQDGTYLISHIARGQWGALEREKKIKALADADAKLYYNYEIGIEQEPGSGGKESAEATVRMLAGKRVFADRVSGKGSKELRAEPFVAQCQNDNVRIAAGDWVRPFLDECLDASTKIITIDGDKSIKDVLVGDLVMTRSGWRRVLKSGCTGRKSLWEITLSSGQPLRITSNHPILVLGCGFLRAEHVMVGDSLLQYTEESNLACQKGNTIFAAMCRALINVKWPCINIFGNARLGLSQKDIISITRMVTAHIMNSPILSAWKPVNIWRCRAAASLPFVRNASAGFNALLAKTVDFARSVVVMPLMATAAVAGRNGDAVDFAATGSIRDLLADNPIAAMNAARRGADVMVNCAVSPIVGSAESLSSDRMVALSNGFVADRVQVVRKCLLTGLHDVYNLVVEGSPEYLANGVLVHNCEHWPAGKYKDQVDACGGAFNRLTQTSGYDISYKGYQ